MIMNKDRVRVIAHQWRYLVLSVAMIAAISLLLNLSRAGKIAAQPIINSDEQILIGMVRQVAERIPRRLNFGVPSPNPTLKLENFIGATGEPMWRTFDGFAREKLTVTRVEVDDFHVKINGDEATVDFLGTIYFKDPALVEEKSSADRFTVLMAKVNGQWRGVPLPPPPPPRPVNDDAPPLPPPPPPPPAELMTVIAGQELNPIVRGGRDSMFDLVRQMADASIRRDTSFFERVLDEDYRETGPNGETSNKAQRIADVKRLDYTIKKFEFDDLSVSGSEHMAFATFLGTVYFETNGQESTLQYRYTINFIKKDGQLKVAAIHMSRKQ